MQKCNSSFSYDDLKKISEWFGPKFDYILSLSENKNEENLLSTSTGVKEYADAIRSWMGRKLKLRSDGLFDKWKNDHSTRRERLQF